MGPAKIGITFKQNISKPRNKVGGYLSRTGCGKPFSRSGEGTRHIWLLNLNLSKVGETAKQKHNAGLGRDGIGSVNTYRLK